MVRGPRVTVAEHHGDLEHVPGELQCQVRAYENVAARTGASGECSVLSHDIQGGTWSALAAKAFSRG
jgi:hypothetical protein